tara:strand:- start:101 stop:250 length:150 start_codon:yes stop_codon:yes gene_type:complete
MIVLEKGGHKTAPIHDFDEAQKMVNSGYKVFINKTGKKLLKKKAKKSTK